jgi:pyridoxine/pyridoxamine 5'-phosphate oxidase
MTFGKSELLDYMRSHRLVVVGSIAQDGRPQSALVGMAVTLRHEIIFDTMSDSRKHGNLKRDARASVAFCGPGEKTLQLEGSARQLAIHDAADSVLYEVYYAAWPEGRQRLAWLGIAHWCIRPTWARYSDLTATPLIKTFDWPRS